jgi:hypothetical protein
VILESLTVRVGEVAPGPAGPAAPSRSVTGSAECGEGSEVAADYTVSFRLGGQTYDEVMLSWTRPAKRCGPRDGPDPEAPAAAGGVGPGSGWKIEVPVVLAILDALERGVADPAQARDMLTRVVERFIGQSGCCPACEQAVGAYHGALEEHALKLARFADSRTYPYLVTTQTIHRWDCRQFRDHRPTHPGASVSEWLHSGHYDRDRNLDRLSPAGARRWLDHRAGRRTAPHRRACRSCRPQLPGQLPGPETAELAAASSDFTTHLMQESASDGI